MPAAGLYSVHPGVLMVQKWRKELPGKSGRSVEEWIELVKKSGPATEAERREWLKKEYKLGTSTARWITEHADGTGTQEDSPEAYLKTAAEYVEAQYGGARAALRPLYDQLLKLGFSMGKDVKACPCKTIVPLYRNHVIAQIKPTTITRIDFGLALGNMRTPKRLINTGGYDKKDRITHRIEVKSKADIDHELKKWLRKAYEMDE